MSTIQSSETFRPIQGFYGYRVSNRGRVQSRRRLCRSICPDNFGEWRDLKPVIHDGYEFVRLCSGEGRVRERPVHHLVLEAFVGPRPEGLLCRHLDGNRRNNNDWNLAWGTNLENSRDSVAHGTKSMGERVNRGVLNEPLVRLLRRAHREGMNPFELSREFRLDYGTVKLAIRRKTWKHVAC